MRRWVLPTFVLAAAGLHWAWAAERCPAGVRPGEWYSSPYQVWKKGGLDTRCALGNLQLLSGAAGPEPTDLNCTSFTDGEEPVCQYTNIEWGGSWCPLEPAADPTCKMVVQDGTECLEESDCYSEYGICRCVRCPCETPGRSGDGCNLCQPAGCDDDCRKRGKLAPGLVSTCQYGPDFYGGPLYPLLFGHKLAQMIIDLEVFAVDDDIVCSSTVYYSKCRSRGAILFAVNFTGCQIGIKEQCLAKGIPTPCVTCEYAKGITIPEDSYIFGTDAQGLFESITTAGLSYGCHYDKCRFFLESLPFDFGELTCDAGTPCAGNSTTGAALGEVTLKNDAAADPRYSIYLAIVVICIFVVAGVVVIMAALYRFKAIPEPMPLVGATISWEGVGLNDIIYGLEGDVRPGQFVAILGTIGAGKSTLLKILAGRYQPTSGTVKLNGQATSDAALRRAVGFVLQDTVCFKNDTVAEAIGFAATMCGGRFPEIGPLMEKAWCRNGTLSGGQRRLVDIYVELARRPSVLLLDEPTTGLDSETAAVLGRLLKEISKSIPVIATLHSPRPELAKQLTDVLIITGGKQVCRAGVGVGHSSAVEGLEALILRSQNMLVPLNSVFDVAVDLASEGVVLLENGVGPSSPVLRHGYVGAEERGAASPVPAIPPPGRAFSAKKLARDVAREAVTLRPTPLILKQIIFLSIRNTKRSIRYGPWKYVVTLIVCIVMGFSFYKVDLTIAGMRNRFGAIFLSHAFFALQGISATSEGVDVQALVDHEIASHVYGRRIDSMVRVMSQLAGQLPHALILSVVVYPLVGLRTDGARPVIFTLCMMATAVASAAMALLCRGRLPSTAGIVAAASLNTGLVFFCGAFTSYEDVPAAFRWLLDISPYRYSFLVTIAHEFIGLQSEVQAAAAITSATSKPLSATGEFYLKILGLPYQLNQTFYNRAKLVGVVSAAWVAAAFVILSLPSLACLARTSGLRRKASEVSVASLTQVVGAKGEAQEATNAGDVKLEVPLQDGILDPDVTVFQKGEEENCVEITWSHLHNPDVTDLSGGVRTGHCLGIVGPCGSGKTTLLRMLAGRVDPAEGVVKVNGQDCLPWQLAGLVGFVPQDDWMCPEDTVAEALEFAASTAALDEREGQSNASLFRSANFLRNMCAGGGAAAAATAGSKVVDKANAKILGQSIGAISPGQRRVTAVCLELARRPLAMLLDEPTSGLDTASSMKLVNLLKTTSKRMPVVMTLHQPRPELQSMLTHVLIMRQGAMAAFLTYEELVKLVSPSPAKPLNQEPDVRPVVELRQDEAQLSSNRVAKEAKVYVSPIDRALEQLDSFGQDHMLKFQPTYRLAPVAIVRKRPSWARLAAVVLVRSLRRGWLRRAKFAFFMLLVWAAGGVILGGAMSGQLAKDTRGVIARLGCFFAINSLIGILTLPTIYEAAATKASVKHEMESQVFSPVILHLCECFRACTDRLPYSIVFSCIIMGFVGLNPTGGHHVIYILVVFLTALLMNLMALAFTSYFSHTNAVNIFNGILVFMLVFGTSFMAINPDQEVPPGSQIIGAFGKLTFMSYAYEAQVENEMIGLTDFTMSIAGVKATWTGEQWMIQLGMKRMLVGNIMILLAWVVFWWACGVLGHWASIRPTQRAASY